jgi:phage shock protein B
MSDAVGVFFGLTMFAVLPLIVIMHYVTRWKSLKGLSAEEQTTLEQLWRDSEAMRERIDALETILDDKVTDWRRDE